MHGFTYSDGNTLMTNKFFNFERLSLTGEDTKWDEKSVADQHGLVYLGIFHWALMGHSALVYYPQNAPIQTLDITSHIQSRKLDVLGLKKKHIQI